MYDHALKINKNEFSAYYNKGRDFIYLRKFSILFRKVWWGNNYVWSCSLN